MQTPDSLKRLGRFPAIAHVAGALILLYLALLATLSTDSQINNTLPDVLSPLLGLIASGALYYAGRRTSQSQQPRLRQAWTALALGQLSYAVGDVIWGFIELGLHQHPFPSLADPFYLAMYPLFLVGIMLLPAAPLSLKDRLLLLIDMTAVMLGALLGLWAFVFGPIAAAEVTGGLPLTLSLAYPLADLALLYGLLFSLLRHPNHDRLPLLLLTAGIGAEVVTDMIFCYESALGTYRSGNLLEAGWLAGALLLSLAGMTQARQRKLPSNPSWPHLSWPRQLRLPLPQQIVLPALGTGIAYTLLIYERNHPLAIPLGTLTWGVGGIIVLLFLRQIIVLRENERLYRAAQSEIAQRRQAEQELLQYSRRLAIMQQISQAVLAARSLRDIGTATLLRIHALIACQQVSIALIKPEGNPVAVVATEAGDGSGIQIADQPSADTSWPTILPEGTTRYVEDLLALPSPSAMERHLLNQGLRCYASLPLLDRDRCIGSLNLASNTAGALTAEHLKIMREIASQLALAAANTHLRYEAEHAATMAERQRLARELHDSVTQSVYSLTLYAGAGRRLMENGETAQLPSLLAQLGETAHQALKEMRLMIYELRPPALEQQGLIATLKKRLDAVERRAGVQVEMSVEGDPALSPACEQDVYQIAQEALNNALKHSSAGSVRLSVLARGPQALEMEISDNGRGFDPKAAADSGGLGMASMRERAERWGGQVVVSSVPGQGACVRVII